jgi:hypothetical protein
VGSAGWPRRGHKTVRATGILDPSRPRLPIRHVASCESGVPLPVMCSLSTSGGASAPPCRSACASWAHPLRHVQTPSSPVPAHLWRCPHVGMLTARWQRGLGTLVGMRATIRCHAAPTLAISPIRYAWPLAAAGGPSLALALHSREVGQRIRPAAPPAWGAAQAASGTNDHQRPWCRLSGAAAHQ